MVTYRVCLNALSEQVHHILTPLLFVFNILLTVSHLVRSTLRDESHVEAAAKVGKQTNNYFCIKYSWSLFEKRLCL